MVRSWRRTAWGLPGRPWWQSAQSVLAEGAVSKRAGQILCYGIGHGGGNVYAEGKREEASPPPDPPTSATSSVGLCIYNLEFIP